MSPSFRPPTRRDLLRTGSALTGGLALGALLPGCAPPAEEAASEDGSTAAEPFTRNGVTAAPTGTTRLSLNPRFSVQVTRALNTAMRLIFSRTKNIASNQTTTNLGLGVEATFVF